MGLCNTAEVLVFLGLASTGTTDDLALLEMLQPFSDQLLKNYLQNDFGYAQHVEYYPIGRSQRDDESILGDIERIGTDRVIVTGQTYGTDALVLKHTPAWLTGLEVREHPGAYGGQATDAFPASSILTPGEDYYLDVDDTGNTSRTGIIYRIGNWPSEPRSVKVTYYGGYSESQLSTGLASAIRYAAMITLAAKYKSAKSLQGGSIAPAISESIGKYSYSTSEVFLAQFAGMTVDIPLEAKMALEPHRNYGRFVA